MTKLFTKILCYHTRARAVARLPWVVTGLVVVNVVGGAVCTETTAPRQSRERRGEHTPDKHTLSLWPSELSALSFRVHHITHTVYKRSAEISPTRQELGNPRALSHTPQSGSQSCSPLTDWKLINRQPPFNALLCIKLQCT